MSEWKKYRLKDLCSRLSSGKNIQATNVSDEGLYPVYGGNGLRGYANISNFEGDCALIGRQGAYCGNVRYFSGRGYITEHAVVACGNDFVCTRFLAYLLSIQDLGRLSAQSAQPGLSVKQLGEEVFSLPPLPTQRKIAAVLGALDDKIENNRKICANLEAQAQAIFKSWFVDFEPFGSKMPEGWKMGKLGDVLQRIGTGLNPRKNFVLGKGKNFYVTIKNMGNNRIYLDEKCDKVDDDAIKRINERSDLKAGDVLFSGIGTIGRTYLIPETPTNWNTSESVFNMRVTEGFPPEFLYLFLLSDPTQEYVQLNALGSAQKGIRMADLKVCPCVIPAQEWLHKFSELVRPIIKTVQEKWREMDLLAALRDALLPKLMSGEIDVEKVKVA